MKLKPFRKRVLRQSPTSRGLRTAYEAGRAAFANAAAWKREQELKAMGSLWPVIELGNIEH